MKIIKINLPKQYVMALWSLFVTYVQRDIINKATADTMFKLMKKFARLHDSEKGKTIDMFLSFDDAAFIWEALNQTCLSGIDNGIITDQKQHLMLTEMLTAFAIELDS